MSATRHQKRLERSIKVTEKLIDNTLTSGQPGKIQARIISDLTRHAAKLRAQLLETMKEH
jgi:hypothetical protein